MTENGRNLVWLSGRVGGKMVSSQTRSGEAAFSFSLSPGGGLRVRINLYGELAQWCDEELEKGSFCQVVGELMNRSGKYGELTEVRAKDIFIHSEVEES